MTQLASLQGKSVGTIRRMARFAAQALLSEEWQDGGIPVDPVKIARSMGASVFVAELGDDVYGMVVGGAGGADIYVDRSSAPVRQRFTVAHELGHVISHQSELADPEVSFVDARSNSGSGTASEIYANEFAAELLMPQDQLVAAIASGLGNFELSQRFEVSLQSVAYRRQVLRV